MFDSAEIQMKNQRAGFPSLLDWTGCWIGRFPVNGTYFASDVFGSFAFLRVAVLVVAFLHLPPPTSHRIWAAHCWAGGVDGEADGSGETVEEVWDGRFNRTSSSAAICSCGLNLSARSFGADQENQKCDGKSLLRLWNLCFTWGLVSRGGEQMKPSAAPFWPGCLGCWTRALGCSGVNW